GSSRRSETAAPPSAGFECLAQGIRPVYGRERAFEPRKRSAPVPPVARRWPSGRCAGAYVLGGYPPGPSLGYWLAGHCMAPQPFVARRVLHGAPPVPARRVPRATT